MLQFVIARHGVSKSHLCLPWPGAVESELELDAESTSHGISMRTLNNLNHGTLPAAR